MFCSMGSSFLYTPEFLKIALHTTSFISFPFHSIAIYCVIRKTPKLMESVKNTMLSLCIWTVILDLQITVFSAPFVTFPVIAGFPLGVLNYLHLPIVTQTGITILAFAGCTTSISCLFANRYTIITSKGSKYLQHYLYGVNITLAVLGCSFCFVHIPEQVAARQYLYETISCIPPDVRKNKMLVVGYNATQIGLGIGSFIMIILCEYFYFVTATLYHFVYQNDRRVSVRTKNLQKQFFFLIILQIFIPFFVILVPWMYAVYSCLTDYYNQALNNLLTIDIGIHGIVSSTSMLLIHGPYRQAVFGRIIEKLSRNARKLNEATSIVRTTLLNI